METAKLKKFAQFARRSLIEQVFAKLKVVMAENSAARRESVEAIKKLDEAIKKIGKEQVVERVAYIWFNRFCALRFMDVNRYTRIGVVSPAEGQVQPEILAEAKMGHIDEEIVSDKTRQQIFALLDGKSPSNNPQGEAYLMLVVGACNHWHRAMPFLFERIDDYTELLMPDDLLSGNSILSHTREAMTFDACRDVEVIGWLYQSYISEKKDEIINRRSVVKKEEIPAATQLFTPKWIVKYMVENSLGRLWMLNRPNSRLVEQMDYYITPEQPETDFLRIGKPEEIKICDPACGSGHILVYAFDLLHAIYEEEGYEPAEIPSMILTQNLYGIEIDERAGELAAFALTMKARARQRRFFRKPVQPNICVLENVWFDTGELKNYMDFVGNDLFTSLLQRSLRQFEEVDNFGSLIRPDATDVAEMLKILESKNISGHLFLSMTHQKVMLALQQADYLSPKYHVVIANPPYMGTKGMNPRLKIWGAENYQDSKTDLFSMFIERNLSLVIDKGQLGFVTPYVWMFISSYKDLRKKILLSSVITNLVQLEYNAFAPACIPVCTFTIYKSGDPRNNYGCFIRLSEFKGEENQAPRTLEAIKNKDCNWRFTACNRDFLSIPENPIGYWLSKKAINVFCECELLHSIATARQGLATADNNRFVRCWHELERKNFATGLDQKEARNASEKWFPYNKGGDFRKWYGNQSFAVNWLNDGHDLKTFEKSVIRNPDTYFAPSLSWSKISSSFFALRLFPQGFIYDVAGCSIFLDNNYTRIALLGVMNSKIMKDLVKDLSPTLNFEVGQVSNFPISRRIIEKNLPVDHINRIIDVHRLDWDSYETSWEFTSLPLQHPDYHQPTLKATYQTLRAHWQEMTSEMQRLEEENNRIFIEAYGLQDELKPEVTLREITLTCNPHYRYGGDKGEEELEALLLADTMREFISYAVGCMFGRYALGKPGLVLANQGETIEDYLMRVPEPSFPADNDNVIPMLDGEWFTDDISERFRNFLRVTFGEEHYEANLKFVEKALGKDIRKYFLKDFYTDHVKRYKKRPIYWLFSSPKASFNALIYMHRYRPDTVSVVLNDYLREFRTKLTSHKNHLEAVSINPSASKGERTKAIKENEKTKKIIDELDAWEHDVLYPLATQRIEIDLDDGVKVNYPKFGQAIKKVPALSEKH